MASSPIGQIPVVITGDWSQLQSSIDQAAKSAEAGAKEISAAFSTASGAATAVGDLDSQLALLYAEGMSASEALAALSAATSPAIASAQALGEQMSLLGPEVGALGENLSSQLALFEEWGNAAEVGAKGMGDLAQSAHSAVPAVQDVSPALQEAAGASKSFADQLIGLGAGILTIQALTSAVKEMVTAFGDIQASEIALRSFTGSAKVAADAIENIQKLANQLAVSQDSLVNFQQRLVAIQIPLEAIPRIAEAAADAAAGMNVSFDTVASQMERMSESGMLLNRSLASLGINIQAVGEAMGMVGASTQEIQKAFQDLGSATERADVLSTAFFTKFQGQADAAAQGVKGLWTVLKNDAEDAFQDLGKDLNGFTGLISGIGASIKFVEDVIFELSGAIKQAVDWLIVAGGDVVTLFKGIGAVISDAMTGNFQKIPEDVKTMLDRVRAYEDAYTSNSKKDWEDTTAAINKLWGDTAANIATGANTIRAALGVDEKAMLDFSKALTGVLDANRALNQNMSDAKATLDAANTAYKLGAISIGELTAAQNAYNSALYAVNPAAQAAAQAAKTFADQIANLKLQVQSVSVDAFAALSGSADQADQALAKVTDSMNQLLDAFQKTGSSKTKQDLQDLINQLAKLQTQLQAIVEQKAFQALGDQLDGLLSKYPHALDTMDQATQTWAKGVIAATQAARESFANLTDKQVIDDFENSLKGLSASADKLANDFNVSVGKMHTAAAEQVKITVDWREEVGKLANSYMEMTTLATKYHLNEISSLAQELTDLKGLLTLQQQFNVPLSQQLATEAKLLQTQIDMGAATGETAQQTLEWQQQLSAVQIKQNLLKQDTLALANLYKDMVSEFGKAWDNLGKNIGDALVDGQNFGAAISKVFDDLKKSLAELVTNYLLGELKRAFLENTDAVNTFGKAFSALFGGGAGGSVGSVTSSIDAFDKSMTDAMDHTVATTSDAASAIASSGEKMSGAMATTAASVNASAASMLAGLDAVAMVVTAIASIFSAIELMHTNTLLDRIEHETARMAIYLGDSGANSIQYYTGKTAEIVNYLHTDTQKIVANTEAIAMTLTSLLNIMAAGGGGGGGGSMGPEAFKALQDEIRGALNVFKDEIEGPYGLGPLVQGFGGSVSQASTGLSNLSTSAYDLGSTFTDVTSTATQAAASITSMSTQLAKAVGVSGPGTPGFNAMVQPTPATPTAAPVGALGYNTMVQPMTSVNVNVTTGGILGVQTATQLAKVVQDQIVSRLQTQGIRVTRG